MCGGIEEVFILDNRHDQREREELWKALSKSRQLNSMNCAYINPDPHIFEEKLPNGLVKVRISYISLLIIMCLMIYALNLIKKKRAMLTQLYELQLSS
jgi:hypothetical protein